MSPQDQPRVWCIMDHRAYQDIDTAMVVYCPGDSETFQDIKRYRDTDWPGYPLVDLQTHTIY